MNTQPRPIEILLVEDNPGDVLLTQEAFEDANIQNRITVAKDGEVALAMLNKTSPYENTPIPDMIFLDLNLPKVNGREVLHELKNNPELKHIPIIVMTASKAERDVADAYKLHANSYIIKPLSDESLTDIVNTFHSFWLNTAVLPTQNGAECD